jgi:molybdopterin converting factor small subunit
MSENKTEEENKALLVVKQGYKRYEYWSREDGDCRNVRAENNLFIVELSIISSSILVALAS